MVGRVDISYALLRSAVPEHILSVLLLTSPLIFLYLLILVTCVVTGIYYVYLKVFCAISKMHFAFFGIIDIL